MKQVPVVSHVTWRRVEIPGAGISIELHPDWPVLEGEHLLYQRFSDEGAVSVRWGAGATIEEALAHTGLGSGGALRKVEADVPITVAGLPGRRVRLRVIEAAIPSPPAGPPSDSERIHVLVGFRVGGTPVLTGYRSPASELAAVEPLLEHILASVRQLERT